jgi:hypothetical protein
MYDHDEYGYVAGEEIMMMEDGRETVQIVTEGHQRHLFSFSGVWLCFMFPTCVNEYVHGAHFCGS